MMSTNIARIRRMIPALVGIVMFSFSATSSRAQKAATENASPAARPSGTIRGHIVNQAGENMNGAVAWALPIGVIAQSRGTSVDGNGNFEFEGLEAGVYNVTAYVPGFVTEPPLSPDESRRYYHIGDSINLSLIKGGVITGTVTTATNAPVVAAAVRAFRLRDANGQPDPGALQPRERPTDDRGVYRFYGLPPGTYVVSVGGAGRFYGGMGAGAYDNDVPTYAPSATRDTAMEIVVGSGEEVTADIQYRGDQGQLISGTLAGLTQSSSQSMGMGMATGTVMLTDVRTRTVLMLAPSSSLNNNSFAFYGVSDGEYEIVAQQTLQSRETMMSVPRRVKVQGADVTGINLSLAPMASITGRLVLESSPPADCTRRRATAAQETLIIARRIKQGAKPSAAKTTKTETTNEVPFSLMTQSADGVPNVKGDFVVRNLYSGSYRIDPQLPSAGWYLRSIAMGAQAIPTKSSDPNVPRDGITLKSGERASSLTVTITEGAAALRGRISVGEGQSVPRGLRVYLVPTEREAAENVLRFFDSAASETDASFAIGNIAPGRYWIIARPADDGDPKKVKPIRQDSALRAKVLREGEAAKKEIWFKPCERAADYDLPYSLPAPLPSSPKP